MTLGLIPIEICELIIDYVALDLSDTRYEQQYTLRACSCVCRSWVPRTCIHLFKYVELTSAERTRLFHNALRAFPALGRYVQTLEVNGSSSRKTQSNNWIYNVVNIFPVLLPALQHLKYSKPPHLHSSFLVMSSEFASIHTLTLEGLNHQSFCELVRLINRFKNLQEVTIFHCTCVSPINFRSKQHDLRCLRLRTVDPQFFDHLLKWGKKTKSGRALVELECDVVAESPVLDEILDSCSSTLRVLTIGLFHQDKLWLPSIATCSSLQLLVLRFHQLKVETIDTVTQWFLLIQSTNISVIKIKTHERDVFDNDYKEVWKLVDTILSSRFAKLEQFEIGLRSFREPISEEVQGLCIHMFPELMKKGKLWLGDYFDERSCQVSRLLT